MSAVPDKLQERIEQKQPKQQSWYCANVDQYSSCWVWPPEQALSLENLCVQVYERCNGQEYRDGARPSGGTEGEDAQSLEKLRDKNERTAYPRVP